jgi:hypothetical protein
MFCPDCFAAMPGAIPENPTLCPNCGDIHIPVERDPHAAVAVSRGPVDPEHIGRFSPEELLAKQNARFCVECDSGGCMF